MNRGELIRRYLFFTAGLFVNALGVSLITKARLGTSPITSIPYVLDIGFGAELGQPHHDHATCLRIDVGPMDTVLR